MTVALDLPGAAPVHYRDLSDEAVGLVREAVETRTGVVCAFVDDTVARGLEVAREAGRREGLETAAALCERLELSSCGVGARGDHCAAEIRRLADPAP